MIGERFDLQGHRGARGLKPENTLPSFETALDTGVASLETDLRLTRDGRLVLFHDAVVSERLCRLIPGRNAPDPATRPKVSTLTLVQLQSYQADRNPDPVRFPLQDAAVTPVAQFFGQLHDLNPYAPPTLADLFAFAAAFAGEIGESAGKTPSQRTAARQVCFDLELKRVPFRPGEIGDSFDGSTAALLERQLLQVIREAGMVERTTVRSFDHRCVRAVRELEPGLIGAVLVAGTAPVEPAVLARQAGAQIYCPEVDFLDERQVRQCHAEGVRVLPWTVNDPDDWQRLLDWGLDGITTDFPDRLADFLRARIRGA